MTDQKPTGVFVRLPLEYWAEHELAAAADCNAMGPTVPSSDMPADPVAAWNTRAGEKA